MKKLLSLMLLLIAVAMAGCFNQDKEKQEEKVADGIEKPITKTGSFNLKSINVFVEKENKYYDTNIAINSNNYEYTCGAVITPTMDSKVSVCVTYSTMCFNEKTHEYDWVDVTNKTESENIYKGKTYFIVASQMPSMKIIDMNSKIIVNEKNETFKMNLVPGNLTWTASKINGSSFRIKDTQSNTYCFNGKIFTALEGYGEIKPNKLYDVMFYDELNNNGDYGLYIQGEYDIKQFKVIGSLLAKDYTGYYDFYSGMKIKLISEKNETIEVPVVWNVRTNTFGIEANGLKYGTYKIKSTYQAERNGYIYGGEYELSAKVLVEYTIDTTMVIDSKTTIYPLQEEVNLVNIGNIDVTYKVIKNLSKNFNSLALCGDFNKWNVKGNMIFKGNNEWEGDIETSVLNTKVLFVYDNRWGNNYGDSNKDGTAEKGSGYINLQFAGKYHVIFNDATMKYSIVLSKKKDIGKNFNEIAVSGMFNGWDKKGNMTLTGAHKWQYMINVNADCSFLFVMNNSKEEIYGDKNQDRIVDKGYNYIALKKGIYYILFDDSTLKYSIVHIKAKK